MLGPSDFNNAVPQFTNGDYASNPINPQYIAEPDAENYNRGSEPLQTLPAQWWNWFLNGFTKRFNKVNIYVKNIFNEITQLLSLVSVTPSGTEDSPTVGQLKDMFETKYPDYLKTTTALSNTYVPQTTKVNGHALSDNVTVTRSDLGLGTSATLDAGSAVGNVPLVGTALGTTNGNILMTDANGKLKPSGVTTGASAGNIPLIGTALGTTDNNIVVTNTSGQIKTFNKTPDNIAYWGNGGAVCSTAAATAAKTVTITGFSLYTGVTVKIMFTSGNTNNTPTLNVNSTGAKNIKVIKAGQKITPPVHSGKWRGASSATNEAWQPLTTLELMYDGTDWVIIGNPVVEDYFSESLCYTVYANGLVEQWGTVTTAEHTSTVNVYIAYNSKDTYWITSSPTTQVTSDDTTYFNLIKIITNSQFSIKWYSSVSGGIPRNKQWKTIGY